MSDEKPVQGGYYLATLREFGIGTGGRVTSHDGLSPLRRISLPDGEVTRVPGGYVAIETGGYDKPTHIVIRKYDDRGELIDNCAYAIDVRELLATPFFKMLIKQAQRQVVAAAEHGIEEAVVYGSTSSLAVKP